MAGCSGRDAPPGGDACSASRPTGTCQTGQTCRAGQCVDDSLLCSASNPNGLCANPAQSCVGGTCMDPDMACSSAHPNGTCDGNTTCRGGQCIDNGLIRSSANPTGLCADTNQSCVDGGCHPIAELCSASNLNGLCAMPLTCHEGTCATDNPCSAADPLGFCPAMQVCIDGTCIDNADLCSPSNPAGACATGKTCLDGTCTADNLLCSSGQPAGLCPTGQSCLNGACIDAAGLCSQSNPTGACATGMACLDGTCLDQSMVCSASNPTGLCAGGDTCLEGTCTDPALLCSSTNQTGLCPDGETCQGGTCEPFNPGCQSCGANQTCLDGICRDDMLLCSATNPTGLCASGYDCIAGTCISAGVECSTNNTTGVCDPGYICNNGTCEIIDDTVLCDDANPCTLDAFDFARNRCSHTAQAGSCTDGNACTNDACVAGACVGTPIGGCIEPPGIDPYVTPTNVGMLTLTGTKPSGASIEINGLEAVSQNPDATWSVVLNLTPGVNVFVIRSVDQAQSSATVEVRIVYDITPPTTSLTPAGGVFLNGITVQVATNEPATVYYTTDGADPDEYSPSFESVKSFRIFDDTTLRFRALDEAGNWEPNPVNATYEITSEGNRWQAGTTLSDPVIQPAAVRLGGSLYVVGGSDGTAPQAGAYRYDYLDNAWTTLPSLVQARAQAAMASDGRYIYIVGGENNGTPTNLIERLEPGVSAGWEARAPMPTTRFGLAAVSHNGEIYVFGGKTNGGSVLTNVEVFSPASNSWTNQVAQMPRARHGFGAVEVAGRIYLVGGEDAAGTPISAVDVYDPADDSWTTAAPLPTPRSFAAITGLSNAGAVSGGYSGIVVAGGRLLGGAATAVVEEYIVEDDAWRERRPLDAPRYSGAAVTIERPGTVDTVEAEAWFIGGQLPSGITDTAIYFTQSQDYVRTLAPAPAARFMHAAAALNGRIYLFGGRNFQEELSAWAFDPETETYAPLPDLPSYQNGLKAAAVGDYVYAIGGANNFGNAVANMRAYDPVTNAWLERTPMTSARRDPAVTLVGTDIYVVGGYNNGALQTVEIYSTTDDVWRTGPVLPAARTGAAAVAHHGEVWVLGGRDAADQPISNALVLRNNAWVAVSQAAIPAAYSSAFLIHNQQIGVFAGRDGASLTSRVWSFGIDSSTLLNEIAAPQRLVRPFDRSASAYLNGKIYLFGGNATDAVGPEGETVVQKIQGHCYNGIMDARESVEADINGGCGARGYEHSTGTGIIFFNDRPSNPSSVQGAIDACNVHYGVTNCAQACGGSYTDVNIGGSCTCGSASHRWSFGSNSAFSDINAAAGVLFNGNGSCSTAAIGNWY